VAGLLIVSIETATGCGSVALTRGGLADGRILAEATAQPELTHSRRLLGSVEWVLRAGGVVWDEVDGIAVSLGPGSFTGLRIGMAAAKGLSFASGVPLLGVETLDAIALSCPYIDRPLWCLLDARKEQLYAACYRPSTEGRPQRCHPAAVMSVAELLEKISCPVLLAGPGVALYPDLLASLEHSRIIPATLSSPRAARLGFLAAGHLQQGKLLDPLTAAPLYVRASEAELNAARRQS